MNANYVQRIRLYFRKFGAARYIGHLDLARTMERALNRAKIPVAYSQGFNRRPRMQFASALPLGYTSDCEIMDILMLEFCSPDDVQSNLSAVMAPGIEISQAKEVQLSEPSLQAQTSDAKFVVRFLDGVDKANLQRKIDAFLAASSFIKQKKGKTKRGKPTVKEYDLRPLTLDLQLQETESGGVELLTHFVLQPSKTGRPDELVEALGIDPLDASIHRTHLGLATDL